jgi:hypothetical protein
MNNKKPETETTFFEDCLKLIAAVVLFIYFYNAP